MFPVFNLILFCCEYLSLFDLSLAMCFRILIDATEKKQCENGCVHKAQIFLFLVSHSDS